jgi:hypothetical protein
VSFGLQQKEEQFNHAKTLGQIKICTEMFFETQPKRYIHLSKTDLLNFCQYSIELKRPGGVEKLKMIGVDS